MMIMSIWKSVRIADNSDDIAFSGLSFGAWASWTHSPLRWYQVTNLGKNMTHRQNLWFKHYYTFSRRLMVGQTWAPEPSPISTVEIMRFDILVICPKKVTFWSSILKILTTWSSSALYCFRVLEDTFARRCSTTGFPLAKWIGFVTISWILSSLICLGNICTSVEEKKKY